MKIATWNVNSIRKRLPAVIAWLAGNRPDVLCLQETKVPDSAFPAEALRATGYHVVFRGRTGFNGIATLSRTPPEYVLHGLEEGPDNEDDRVLQTVVGGIPIVNTYVPQGGRISGDKYPLKLEWFRRIRRYFEQRLDPSQPALWVGDLNVAPEPVDVFDPQRCLGDADFHIDARNAYREALAWGFIDVFRMLYPDRVQYTFWDYYGSALRSNHGWRIDHILATAALAQRCRTVEVDMAPRRAPEASDHTVVWAEFD